MAQIKPFQAVMYNKEKCKDIAKVISPPYDIISPKQQGEYYQNSPYNIIRIILGKDLKNDNEEKNKYTRAAGFFSSFLKKKILIQDEKKSFYIYEQDFFLKKASGRKNLKRTGFLALVKTEPFGKSIFPHEQTFPKHKQDRAKLLKACQANFSPIFGLYAPKDNKIQNIFARTKKLKPIFQIKFQDVVNKIWRIENKEDISQIIGEISKNKTFIADGHHRYETALEYAQEMKAKNPDHTGNETYNYIMMMFVGMNDPGLEILPTHRILKIGHQVLKSESLEASIKEYFKIQEFKNLANMMKNLKKVKYGFGMYDGRNYLILKVNKASKIAKNFDPGIPKCWKTLDMVLLHHFFFKRILGIEPTPSESIKYVVDPMEAADLVKKDEYQVAFFLNSVKPEIVKNIALSGEKMPHKATYFYPKPLSGLIINKM